MSNEFNEELKEFEEQMSKCSHLAWKDENGDMEVVVPKTPKDIVRAAAELNNQMYAYIPSIINGFRVILLVKKEGKTYMALEVKNDKIVQAKGKVLPALEMKIRREMIAGKCSKADKEWVNRYAACKNLVVAGF